MRRKTRRPLGLRPQIERAEKERTCPSLPRDCMANTVISSFLLQHLADRRSANLAGSNDEGSSGCIPLPPFRGRWTIRSGFQTDGGAVLIITGDGRTELPSGHVGGSGT